MIRKVQTQFDIGADVVKFDREHICIVYRGASG